MPIFLVLIIFLFTLPLILEAKPINERYVERKQIECQLKILTPT